MLSFYAAQHYIYIKQFNSDSKITKNRGFLSTFAPKML